MASRDDSDEAHVIGLRDRILGEQAMTQHRFDWLLGDPGAGGRQVRLPVDAYWAGHRLVVEYREFQHDEPMPQFDKPDRLTVSGTHRAEQRALYDARHDTEIPAHGLRLVVVRPADLDADGRGRLRRSEEADLATLRKMPARGSDEDRVTDALRAWLLGEGWTPMDAWGLLHGTLAHDSVELIAAELAANAVTHDRVPGRDAELRLSREEGGHVRVEVSDARRERLPEAREAGSEEDGGQGRLLVAPLAEEWGTAPRPGAPGRRCGPWCPPRRSVSSGTGP
ncbi:ATP-binding protein [Streptomyces althioticus]|uniref:ATP-binding protein n=1 Tax=Streptomyces althioticus TaxID=83380 RepID=UPI0036B6A408